MPISWGARSFACDGDLDRTRGEGELTVRFVGRTDLGRAQRGRRDRRGQPQRDQAPAGCLDFARDHGVGRSELAPRRHRGMIGGSARSGGSRRDRGAEMAVSRRLDWDRLAGWEADDHEAALAVFLVTSDLEVGPEGGALCARPARSTVRRALSSSAQFRPVLHSTGTRRYSPATTSRSLKGSRTRR
jgi:hypothetical protein